MKRIFLLVTAALLSTACTVDGQTRKLSQKSTKCPNGANVAVRTGIIYGDSQIIVRPVTAVRPGSEFEFLLKPREKSTDKVVKPKDAKVTIVGTFAGKQWLDVNSKSFKDTGKEKGVIFAGCVPTKDASGNPIKGGTSLKYLVKVEDVGELDPRADVVY